MTRIITISMMTTSTAAAAATTTTTIEIYIFINKVLITNSDVNKARTLKAKAKAIPVGNEAGTVSSQTAMGHHGK